MMRVYPRFVTPGGKPASFLGLLFLLTLTLAACSAAIESPSPATEFSSPATLVVESSSTPTPSDPQNTQETIPPTNTPLPDDFWQSLPVIPTTISERVRTIYQLGAESGKDPHIFSRIGDCASAAPAFLAGFDSNYNLGEYSNLQPAIDHFKGSFRRPSLAAKAGLNTAGVLTTLWTDEKCLPNESLLSCQYRLDEPAFAIIALGTNEAYYVHRDPASFERNLRVVLEETISQGIVPVLATKADNVEGDHSINATIAKLAMEYEIPLWNFWLAVQPLPNQGMIEPEHLSSVSYANFTDFTIPHALEYGMQVRNLTALQILNFLMEDLISSTQ